jgi:HlyD family secretion protein
MRKKRIKLWRWWATVVLVAAAGGCGRGDNPAYQTAPVERGDVTQVVTATGTLNPVLNVQVGCQVSGRISKLYVDYNSPVTNGQLIAEIDPRTYEAQVAQATADLANARANLELQQAEAERAAELFSNKLISRSDYDTAIATLHEAQASVQIKEASLSNALANLGFCKIYSPVDGVVISRAVDVGQTVAASLSAPTLFQIANDLTRMQIDAAVDEADIGGVKVGEAVDFTVDAYPNRTFHGVVTQVRNAPTTVNNVVTYDTVIGVTNSDYSLKPGMTASVSIIVAQRTNVLVIPNSALRFRPAGEETNALVAASNFNPGNAPAGPRRRGPGGRNRGESPPANLHTVYLLNPATGKPEPVQIQTGITDNIDTEVISGLKEGDNVITGLQIPGLTSDRGTENPFMFRRRF